MGGERNPMVISHHLIWREGLYWGFPDEVILKAARAKKLTLVTYDQNMIPPILWAWGESGETHGGVIRRFKNEGLSRQARLKGMR